MDKVIVFIALVAIGLGLDLFFAQIIDWSLATYHINSGIAGPFGFIVVASSLVAYGKSK